MMRRPPTSTRTTTRHPYTARFRSTHIDGKLIYGSSLDDSIKLMRGKPGTKIALTLVRPGRDKPIDVTLTREVIVQKPVKWEVRGDVGVINIKDRKSTRLNSSH